MQCRSLVCSNWIKIIRISPYLTSLQHREEKLNSVGAYSSVKYFVVVVLVLWGVFAAQGHPLSEITPIDTNLDMGSYNITTKFLTVSGRSIYMGGGSGLTWGLRYSTSYPDYGIFYTEGTPDYVSISPSGGGITTPDLKVEGNGAVTIRNGLTVSAGTVSLPGNQIDSAEVSFNYAGSSEKGGPATDLSCTDCVTLGTETTGNYAAGTSEGGDAIGLSCTDCVELGTETTGNYAGSNSEGGPATDLECTNCVGTTELASVMSDYQEKSFGTYYQASTDGFVVAYIAADNDGERGYVSGYTEDPYQGGYVLRARANVHYHVVGIRPTPYNSFTMPVKQGHWWYATKTDTYGTCYAKLWFVPFG